MAGQQTQRHLSAIVFTDIVGYSALVNRDEALGARLLDRQREVVRRWVPQNGGREIETAGDSFLLEFGSTLAAVRAVLEIQQELTRINSVAPEGERVVLRASVHLGDIEHRGKEVFGNGVNVAARLLPLSPEGGMAMSASVLDSVRQRLPLPARSIGTPPLKNIETPVEVFVVEAREIASMATVTSGAPGPSPEPQSEPQAVSTGTGARRWAVPAGVAIVVAALAGGYLATRSQPSAALDKSVAVLPFANMSTDASNAYFADGMQDQILSNLSRIRDLKVISRSSVERYRGQVTDPRTIARELDVAAVVEGSVQRVGDRVRITAQLIDATRDAHLWAETYDRDLADVFAVQSEIAGKIADSLHATLLPSEAEAIAVTPTRNQKAYDLYLQAQTLGRPFMDERLWSEDVLRAESLLEQSVKEDPAFALGWADLATLQLTVYWTASGRGYRTKERLERAKAAAERAVSLQPGLEEAHHAMALYHYWGHFDYESALREIELSQAAMQSSDVALIAAAIVRRQGRFEDAGDLFHRAAALDPRQANNWSNLGMTQLILGRWDDAQASHDRAVAVSANPRLAREKVSGTWAGYTGDMAAWRNSIEALPSGAPERVMLTQAEFWLRLNLREYDEAEAVLNRVAGERLDGYPVAWYRGVLEWNRGNRDAARAAFSEARPLLEAWAAEGNNRVLQDLGDVYAGLGLREQALTTGQRAVQLAEKDAFEGPRATLNLAYIHLLLGEEDQALTYLEEYQKRLQGAVSQFVLFLQADGVWDPLRGDPRFQQVLAAIRQPRRSPP